MKLLLLSGLVVSLALVGCNAKDNAAKDAATTESSTAITDAQVASTPLEDAQVATSTPEVKVIHFTGPQDLTLELKSDDDFETAQLTDNSDQTYELKAVVSASGLKMANAEGVSIHFKNGEGIVELVKDKPIEIKEFKATVKQS